MSVVWCSSPKVVRNPSVTAGRCTRKFGSVVNDDAPNIMADHFYSPRARLDLLEIWEHIAADDLDTADRIEQEIQQAVAMLAHNPELKVKRSVMTWRGANTATASQGFGVRVFKSTWENPFPGSLISSLDYESTLTHSAPFLLAISAE